MSARLPHPLWGVLATFAALALSGPAAADPSRCASPDLRPGAASEDALESATLCLVNRERARRGLRALHVNRRLSRAALSHTHDMVQKRYFGHVSRNGLNLVDRLRLTGYLRRAQRWLVGENLAWGMNDAGTPRSTVAGWMRSPPHRRNILNRRFREIGIGVAELPFEGSSGAAAYTTTFGYRR